MLNDSETQFTDHEDVKVAHCGVHPDAPATLTCRHCGAYACPECEVVLAWGDVLCASCDAAGRGVYPVAFERGGGLVATARAIGAAPTMVFTRIGRDPRAPLGRALVFASVSSLAMGLGGLAILLLSLWMTSRAGLGQPADLTTFGLFPFATMTGGVVGGLGAAAMMAVLVPVLGGALPLRAAIRATFYARATWLIAAPFTLLVLLPAVGTMLFVLLIVGVASYELAAYRSIAHGTGLSSARARVTAAAAFVAGWSAVALSTLTCICGGGVMRAVIQMAGQ